MRVGWVEGIVKRLPGLSLRQKGPEIFAAFVVKLLLCFFDRGLVAVFADDPADVLRKLIHLAAGRSEVVRFPTHTVFRDMHFVRPPDMISGLLQKEAEAFHLIPGVLCTISVPWGMELRM